MLQFHGRFLLSPAVLCFVCLVRLQVTLAAPASDESWETIEILQKNDVTDSDLDTATTEKTIDSRETAGRETKGDDNWETNDSKSWETKDSWETGHNEVVPEDHVTVLEFIAKVLGTAQHRSKMAVERARKRAALSRTIKEDAEKLLAEAETLERKIRKSDLLADLMTSKQNEI